MAIQMFLCEDFKTYISEKCSFRIKYPTQSVQVLELAF